MSAPLRSRQGRVHACLPLHRVSTTGSSSMMARSPNGKSGRVTLSALGAASRRTACGMLARAPARSASNGCCAIPRCGQLPSSNRLIGPCASPATLGLRRAWTCVVEGQAPPALQSLPEPDAIFIGGGGSEDGVIETAIAALKSGGRLVANAVTLEMEAKLLGLHAEKGGTLTRSILRAPRRSAEWWVGDRRCQ
jgi:hypothetical protein